METLIDSDNFYFCFLNKKLFNLIKFMPSGGRGWVVVSLRFLGESIIINIFSIIIIWQVKQEIIEL